MKRPRWYWIIVLGGLVASCCATSAPLTPETAREARIAHAKAAGRPRCPVGRKLELRYDPDVICVDTDGITWSGCAWNSCGYDDACRRYQYQIASDGVSNCGGDEWPECKP